MAKGKEVSEQEILDAVEQMEDGARRLVAMAQRMMNGHTGKIADPLSIGRNLVCVARDANNFALRMFSAHDSNETTKRIEAMR